MREQRGFFQKEVCAAVQSLAPCGGNLQGRVGKKADDLPKIRHSFAEGAAGDVGIASLPAAVIDVIIVVAESWSFSLATLDVEVNKHPAFLDHFWLMPLDAELGGTPTETHALTRPSVEEIGRVGIVVMWIVCSLRQA